MQSNTMIVETNMQRREMGTAFCIPTLMACFSAASREWTNSLAALTSFAKQIRSDAADAGDTQGVR